MATPKIAVAYGHMKPHPAPEVPGETEWQRFDNAVRNIFKVPESAILRERERMKAEREKKKDAKKDAKKAK